ncbi:uncharacterized protein LOC143274784 [Babylonia areolata]|uniref:uncharacterized protein LOC143274784 n=1 Tax=Babylonia areolata TaxID=304850 RepID=UPI003FD10273
MDERNRDSLQRHHSFLMTHIFLTDDVIQLLSSEKILPETMIKDIQDGDTKEERNKRLLNALRLRGNKSYKRFRELMYRTGNFFVADLLWEEEEGPGLLIDEEELTDKFSSLMHCMHDTQRRKLLHYLDAKIREKSLVLAWRERPAQRLESLGAKVVDFNQERGLRDTVAAQERKIKAQEGQLRAEEDKVRAVRLELSSLQQQVKVLRQDHVAQLATQSRFQDANMLTITRLKNRLSSCKTKVAELNRLMSTTLDGGIVGKEKATPRTGGEEEEVDGEEGEVKMEELEKHLHELLQQYHFEKGQARSGRTQRDEVLKLLNRGSSSSTSGSGGKDSLVSVVKEVLKHEQKHRAVVMRDIQRLSDTLRQVVPSSTLAPPAPVAVNPQSGLTLGASPVDLATLDTKHFKNQLAMLRVEAEHIQKRFQWKDSETLSLRQELFAVKQRFHDYKIINSAARQPPPPASHTHNPHPVCASCGKSMAPCHTTGSPHNGQETAQQTLVTSTNCPPPPVSSGVSQDENRLHAGAGDEDTMSQGCDSRRGSISRSDLDKMVVNVDEYLQDEDGLDEYDGAAFPMKPTPSGMDAHTEGEDNNNNNNNDNNNRSFPGTPSVSQTPVKRAGEVKSGETRSKRDVKNGALSKAQVKRKTIQK